MKQQLPSRVNRRIGQAMHDYAMLADGDRILVGVSGGIDSLVVTQLLDVWQHKAPVSYGLEPVHIDMGYDSEGDSTAELIKEELGSLASDLKVVRAHHTPAREQSCFECARNRRRQLFDLAAELGCNKIALGHHKDDLIETLFLNMVYSGNISTMVPRQDLFHGKLALIRPMAYLEKEEVREIGRKFGLQPVKNLCPLAGDTKRDRVRELLEELYRIEPEAKASLFSAMANVRHDYLLKTKVKDES
ncbi:MAG: ATP-binding protein [Thermodesulfobacteriota bacterium]